MRNIITQNMPSAVKVGGIYYAIKTDFRTSLQVARLLSSSLPERTKRRGVLAHYYGADLPQDIIEAYKACFAFLSGTEEYETPKGAKQSRDFDFDFDQMRLVADFQREYQIDLTNPELTMHWWRFLALFNNLSNTSQTMTIRGYRSCDIPKDAPPETKERIKEIKRQYALPPISYEEEVAREKMKWGD